MVVVGIAFVTFGVVAEILGGTYFREFSNPRCRRNPKLGWRDDVWIKIVLARCGLLVGLVLGLVGLITR